jgi:hypothetical protein
MELALANRLVVAPPGEYQTRAGRGRTPSPGTQARHPGSHHRHGDLTADRQSALTVAVGKSYDSP